MRDSYKSQLALHFRIRISVFQTSDRAHWSIDAYGGLGPGNLSSGCSSADGAEQKARKKQEPDGGKLGRLGPCC